MVRPTSWLYSRPELPWWKVEECDAREDIEAEVRILVLVRKIGKYQNNLLPVRGPTGP